MTFPATWLRLVTACTLAWLVGCEQPSYSSHSEPAGPALSQAASSPSELSEGDANDDAAAEAASPSPAVATTEPATVEATPTANEAAPAETAESPSAKLDEAAPAAAKGNGAKEDKSATKDLTFDDIKFDIEKDGLFERSMLTPEIEALVGRTIRIRGYILPTFQQSNIRNFVLVRDNMECCFGPGAALYDCIVVDMVPGQSTNFTTRPVAVEGTFGIKELLDFDGVVRAIYHLEGKAVK